MPVLLEACVSPHADLRQCAVYGVGIVAAKCGEGFRPYLSVAMERISAIMGAEDARGEDNEQAYDNAVAVLGKILAHQVPAGGTEGAELAATWLRALPLKVGCVGVIHSILCF